MELNLLCNENIPLASVRVLRDAGYDVVSISETSPGISDTAVLKLSREQSRVLITFDADYGELIYLRNLPAPRGIIFLRFNPRSSEEPAKIIQSVLDNGEKFIAGFFLTVSRESIRRRPLFLEN